MFIYLIIYYFKNESYIRSGLKKLIESNIFPVRILHKKMEENGKMYFCEAPFINNKFCDKKIKTSKENIHKKFNIFQFIKYSAVYVCNYNGFKSDDSESCIFFYFFLCVPLR